MAKVRLAVLFGGATKDHKVSLMSAYSLLNGLSPDKYDVTPIGITRAGRWLYFPGSYEEIKDGTWEQSSDCCSAIISPDPLHAGIITIMSDGSTAIKRVDAVMSVLHGKYGEGGRIQALLKLSKIPYVDCDPETAMYCMDKALTHIILSSVGVDVPKYAILERSDMNVIGEKIAEIEKKLTYPVFVSASSCSTSVNSSAIYTGGFIVDPEVTDTQREKIYAMAKKIFRCMSFKGYAKMSFRLAGERVLLRRVSVIPGFTPESAIMILMKASGYEYSDAIDRLIGLAIDIDA